MGKVGAFIIGGTALAVVLITSIILIAVSFSVLETTQMGIAVNGNTQEILLDEGNKPYKSGRYMLGLGWYFIVYPSTVVSVHFTKDDDTAMQARSRDGLNIELDVAFEYRLIESELLKLYYKFGEDYQNVIEKLASDSVRLSASRFPAFDFFTNRNNVSDTMFVDLQNALLNYHATINSFQLLNIQFPAQFDNAIALTEVTRQQIATSLFEQQRAITQAETQVLAASQQVNIIQARAAADAANLALVAQAEADALYERVANLVTAYSGVMSNYTMTEDELLTWVWLQALQDTQATVSLNAKKPADIVY